MALVRSIATPTKRKAVRSSIKKLLAVLLFLLLVAVFIILAHEVVQEKEDWFDTKVFNFFSPYSSAGVVAFLSIITFFGSMGFLLPAYIILCLFLVYRKRQVIALNIALFGLLSTAVMFLLKLFFARHRPESPLLEKATNYSFPSGHTLTSVIFYSILAWLVWQSKAKRPVKITTVILLLFFPMAIGISRIVLRYHYASDVAAGFVLGMAMVLLYFVLWNRKLRSSTCP